MTMSHSDAWYHSVEGAYASQAILSDGITTRATVPMGTAFPAWWARKTVEIADVTGRPHYMTEKQERVYLALAGMIAAGNTNTSFRKVAASLGVCVTTVSNMARKLMAWGLLGYLSSRGRYGGVTLFGRVKGDGLDRFARMARDAIKVWWRRKMDGIRAHSNVHTPLDRVKGVAARGYLSSSVDIRIRRDDEIEDRLAAMQRGSLKRVPCPAHEGRDRNLSFWRRPDGSLGVKCWSHQCTEREVKDALVPWPL
jgi:hypothetical protein